LDVKALTEADAVFVSAQVTRVVKEEKRPAFEKASLLKSVWILESFKFLVSFPQRKKLLEVPLSLA
jgi:hypothetical protein